MKKAITLAVIVSLLAILAACAPAATTPAPAAPTSAPATSAGPKTTPAVSAADAAWQKVIDAAKKEGSVTMYSFNFGGDVGLAVGKAFQDKYGIKLDIVTGRGAEQVERLKTERRTGSQVADFMDGSRVYAAAATAEGLTYALTDLPVLKDKQGWNLDPFVLDDGGRIVAFNYFVYSPFINTNLVKPADQFKSFKDLLDPKWKGKLMMPDPNVSGAAYEAFVALLNAKALDMDYLKALGNQNLVFTIGDDDSVGKLARGEYPVSIRTTPTIAATYIVQGAPIKAVTMAEGHVGSALAATAIKDSPHQNATKLFINWLMSQEGQTVFGKAKVVSSMRKDVKDFSPEAAQSPGAKVVMPSQADTDQAAQMFKDKVFVNLWKK